MSCRLRVGVLFGGCSGEHEVSLQSAEFVLEALDPEHYEVVPIGITRGGQWLVSADPMRALREPGGGAKGDISVPVALPNGGLRQADPAHSNGHLDVVFPVLHGPYGEDGTVQGLFELSGIPYIGSGVTGSAVGMDKGLANSVLRDSGLPIADWMVVTRREVHHAPDLIEQRVGEQFDYPVFVKPCNLGSSIGITKLYDVDGLAPALRLAAEFDRRIIIEQSVSSAREIEVSVLGNEVPEASVCGEIIHSKEFYDYDAKYEDRTSQPVIPADLPTELADRIRGLALEAFRAVDGAGYARVDFLVDGESLEPFVGEINTIPGFTSVSMFPKLWEATGVGNQELVSRLIELALDRHRDKQKTRRSRM